MTVEPAEEGVVDGAFLVVLSLGKAHGVFLLFAVLVREDNHEVFAGEIAL